MSLRSARAEYAFFHEVDVGVKGPLSPMSSVLHCSFDRHVSSVWSNTSLNPRERKVGPYGE